MATHKTTLTNDDDRYDTPSWAAGDYVIVRALDGNDTLFGGGNFDFELYAGKGNDVLYAYSQRVTYADGGVGDDQIFGGSYNTSFAPDTLVGGAGDDVITVQGDKRTFVDGGLDNDYISISCRGVDTINGGSGNDWLQLQAYGSEGVGFSLGIGGFAGAYAIGDLVSGVEALGGTQYADTLEGDILDNVLMGGHGGDVLRGGDGKDLLIGADFNNFARSWLKGADYHDAAASTFDDGAADTLEGGAGDDTLIGGLGADVLTGGAGLDTASYVDSQGFVFVNLKTGVAMGGTAAGDIITEIENLEGSRFGDTLIGDNGANVLDGRDGDDGLKGGDGKDTLIGGAGADTLDGGSGADRLVGGVGSDTYAIDNKGDVIVGEQDFAETDYVYSSIDYVLGAGLENLTLTGKAVEGVGNGASNVLTGNKEHNMLFGLDGADTLDGGNGNDTLSGGSGVDRLTGGKGADQFLFDRAPGEADADVIVDFSTKDDFIALDADMFIGLTAGAKLLSDQFAKGEGLSAALDANDRIIYDTATGNLYFDADGVGGVDAVLFAKLETSPDGLKANDFLIV